MPADTPPLFAYTMVGSNDLDRSIRFYDALMDRLGQPRCLIDDEGACWGTLDNTGPAFCITRPFDGRPATVGNGVMLAFGMPSAAMAKALHALALEMGGTCEGAPGLRPQYGEGFYAAYARDPDGNKIAFVRYDVTEEEAAKA